MTPPSHEASIFRPTKASEAGSGLEQVSWPATPIAQGVEFLFQPMGGEVVARAYGRDVGAMGATFWPPGTDLQEGDGVLITRELGGGSPIALRWEVKSSSPQGDRFEHEARLVVSKENFG